MQNHQKLLLLNFLKEIEDTNPDEEIAGNTFDTIDTQTDEFVPSLGDKDNLQQIEDSNELQQNVDTNQNETDIIQTNEILQKGNLSPSSNTNEKASNNNKSIIQNTTQDKKNIQKKQVDDSTIIKKLKPSSKKIKFEKEPDNKIKKENNLTVEDIELGLILNQINLECDSSKYTDTITYYDGMGPALYRLCKFNSSLSFFDEALVKDPGNVEILSNKGSALGKLGFYNEAIIYYDNVLKIDPEFLPAINNKANALANLGQHNEAKFLYQHAIEKNPSYFTARKNLSLLENELNQEKIITLEEQSSIHKLELIPLVNNRQVENSQLPKTKNRKLI